VVVGGAVDVVDGLVVVDGDGAGASTGSLVVFTGACVVDGLVVVDDGCLHGQ